jgi:hypothetical protein
MGWTDNASVRKKPFTTNQEGAQGESEGRQEEVIIPMGAIDANVAHIASTILGRHFHAAVKCVAHVKLIKGAHTEIIRLSCKWIAR